MTTHVNSVSSSSVLRAASSGGSAAKTAKARRRSTSGTQQVAGSVGRSKTCSSGSNCGSDCAQCAILKTEIQTFFGNPPIILASAGARKNWEWLKTQCELAVNEVREIPQSVIENLSRVVAGFTLSQFYSAVCDYLRWLAEKANLNASKDHTQRHFTVVA